MNSFSLPPDFLHLKFDPNKEAAIARCLDLDLAPQPNSLVIYSDSSLLPDEGVGAAALHTVTGTQVSVRLGSDLYHTVYEAELVGLTLATRLAKALTSASMSHLFLLLDNQACILAMASPLVATPGQNLRLLFLTALNALHRSYPNLTVHLCWCPGHVGLDGNEAVDELAKTAVLLTDEPLNLSISLSSVKQLIKHQLRTSIITIPPGPILSCLRDFHDPLTAFHALSSLPWGLCLALVQLRANHAPLNDYLYWRKAAASPNCDLCNCPETTEHFLLICRRYIGARN